MVRIHVTERISMHTFGMRTGFAFPSAPLEWVPLDLQAPEVSVDTSYLLRSRIRPVKEVLSRVSQHSV